MMMEEAGQALFTTGRVGPGSIHQGNVMKKGIEVQNALPMRERDGLSVKGIH